MKSSSVILAVAALFLLVLAGTVADMNKTAIKVHNRQPMHVVQRCGGATLSARSYMG